MKTGIKTKFGTKIVSINDKQKIYKALDMAERHKLKKINASYLDDRPWSFYGLYLYNEKNVRFDKISNLDSANIILETLTVNIPELKNIKLPKDTYGDANKTLNNIKEKLNKAVGYEMFNWAENMDVS